MENKDLEHSVISSLIVECLVEDRPRIEELLAQTEGVEVHGSDKGQIVITIETQTLSESHDLANSITFIDGVTAVNLIYANFEDDPETQEAFDKLQARTAKED